MLSVKRKNSGEAMLASWACGLGVMGEWRRGDAFEVGFVGVKVVAVWWSCSGGVVGGGVVFGPK